MLAPHSLRFDRSGNLETGLFFEMIDPLSGLKRYGCTDEGWPFQVIETGKGRRVDFLDFTHEVKGEFSHFKCKGAGCSTSFGGAIDNVVVRSADGRDARFSEGKEMLWATSGVSDATVMYPGLLLYEPDCHEFLKRGFLGVTASSISVVHEYGYFGPDIPEDEWFFVEADIDPGWYAIEPCNGNMFARRQVFPSGKWTCPQCGAESRFCGECGNILDRTFQECECEMIQDARRLHIDGRDPNRLLLELDPLVILGEKWRGQDMVEYMGRLAVSRRVVRYFQEADLGPCIFSSVYLCTDNMGVTQKRLLKNVSETQLL